jgi:nucleotide-binding universal stress UspA family protein
MPKIERILCPTDLSEPSRRSLDHALVLARRSRARIEVLHVIDRLAPLDLAGALKSFIADAWEEEIAVHPVLREGAVAATVIEHARDMAADLIVMGAHGRGAVREAILGSVATAVVREAPCPVLAVRHPAQAPLQAGGVELSRVLCAVDFSTPSLAALDYGAWLTGSDGALAVLHVLEVSSAEFEWAMGVQAPGEEQDVRASLLARVPEALRPRCEILVSHGDAREEIVRAAVSWRAHLIVMGVHGRGTLGRTLFGSRTSHVLRMAPCAVLTLRSTPVGAIPDGSRDARAGALVG